MEVGILHAGDDDLRTSHVEATTFLLTSGGFPVQVLGIAQDLGVQGVKFEKLQVVFSQLGYQGFVVIVVDE